ncbi:MAG: GAF domain-containing protein, partial [Balneolaceae bacterium]|nr:GAF domain-containing protein [Balneolaceae bacterium]
MKAGLNKHVKADKSALDHQRREAELTVIKSVQEGIAARKDIHDIYDQVGECIRDLFDAQVAAICTFDLENRIEHFQYSFEDGKRIYPESRPIDKIRGHLIDTKNLLLINSDADRRIEEITGRPHEAVPGTELPKSLLYVPLMIGRDIMGYVTLQNLDREDAFSDADVVLLESLANSLSIALENARLFSESEQRSAELSVINSVQVGLAAEMDMQGIYELVGEQVRDLFDAQVAAICNFDLSNRVEHFQYSFEDGKRIYPESRPIDKIREHLIVTKDLLLINSDADRRIEEITGKPHEAVPGTELPKSLLYVPLLVGDKITGYVTLQNLDREYAFRDSDVKLLRTLTNSMSIALENARLFNETEQRNAELAIITGVQEGLVREMEMHAIYSLVGDTICKVLDTQTLLIRTFDLENGLEHWEYVVEKGQHLEAEPRPLIWANKQLIKSKEYLLINEQYTKTAIKYGGKGYSKGLPPKSAIFVPMIIGGEVIGSVSLQNVDKEHAYSKSDVRLLTTLTNSMSVALENARLFKKTSKLLEESHQRATELDTVNRVSRALVTQLELDSLIELVGELMQETFEADIVYVALYDRSLNMLHFPYTYGESIPSRPFESGITEKIITKQEPILINTNLVETFDRLEAEKKGEWVSSFLGVPIISGSDAIGVISIQSTEEENRFDENDQRLLNTIAANVGIAMQNAEAYEKLRNAMVELKSTQEQLVQQEKLASLGQLTAGIAHEIKNPLNFVNNFSDLSIELIQEALDEVDTISNGVSNLSDIEEQLQNLVGLLTDVKSNLGKIYKHGSRTDGIVKSMLQHSRGGSGKMEPTDLNALVKEFTNLAYHGMRAG